MIRKLEVLDVEFHMCPYCGEVFASYANATICAENCYQDRLADTADDDRKEMRLNRLYSDE